MGQSLGAGEGQSPVPPEASAYAGAALFDSAGTYDVASPNAPTLSLASLPNPQNRGITQTGEPYPVNIVGKTPENFCAATLTAVSAGQAMRLAATNVAIPGASMVQIQKGGTLLAYDAAIYEVEAIGRLAAVDGETFGVEGVVLTHTEADAELLNTDYEPELIALQLDTQTDASASTGQTRAIPLYASQTNSFPPNFFSLFGSSAPTSGNVPARAILGAADASTLDAPIVAVGPKYQYLYADGVHLLNYAPLGDKNAEAAIATSNALDFGGPRWQPMRMLSATRAGAVITLTMHVPYGPCIFDTQLGPGPHQDGPWSAFWSLGLGFEAYEVIGNVIAATSTSPIVATLDVAHGLTTGTAVGLSGIDNAVAGSSGTLTNANGVYPATVVSPTSLSLDGSTSNGTFATPGNLCVPIEILDVAIVGYASIAITCSRASTSSELYLGYADQCGAAYGVPVAGGRFPGGRYGLVRDQDPFRGLSGQPNYNFLWAGALLVDP